MREEWKKLTEDYCRGCKKYKDVNTFDLCKDCWTKLKKKPTVCPDCGKDKDIFCPRNVDGQCLECGAKLCAGHLMEHFKKVHFMALDFNHCSNK